MKRNVLALLALFLFQISLAAQTRSPLLDDWQLQSACKDTADGAAISVSSFAAQGWIKTSVPSTVLAAQVKAGLLPDPYFGDNLRKIPGTTYPIGHNFSNIAMSPDSPYACAWWYRKQFNAPVLAARDNRLWLHFGGINYRGELWINGKKIADATQIAGAYRTYDFDITESITPGKPNVIAVKTTAPTEKDLGINWVDWNPCPPDKDMGLWGAVDLVQTSPVTVRSPLATTHFPDASLNRADITVYAELHNASAGTIKGIVSGTVAGVKFEKPVELAAHEDQSVAFSPEQFPALRIQNPKLWWPRQMGDPHLEHLTVSFSTQGHITDEQSVNFGIREVTSELTANGSRLFRINGKPILIRGAGWSQDMLLRTDDNRLRSQFDLVENMNLNTIRLEGKLETEEFFHLADERGILVMLGWCCCDHWEHWKDWAPQDLAIATASLRSQMLRLRHHASLLVWLNGSDNPPVPEVEKAYLQVESETHWPNPILSSATQAPTPVTGESGVKMTGPYDYVAPSYWYYGVRYGGARGYNTETSPGPAISSLASRKLFLSDPEAWPPSADWSLHYGGGEFANLKVFDAAMEAVYARPQSAADYERMANTMEYDSERAMYEAYSKNKYTSTGVVQWMLNNAWPSMIWHLYDYFLDTGGGYFGAKKACEPLHIQYAYDDHAIDVVNSTYSEAGDLHAEVHVYGLAWNEVYKATSNITARSDSSQRVFTIPAGLYSGPERILFVDLALSGSGGKVLSHNFYWVPTTLTSFDWEGTDYTHTPASHHEDLTALTRLPAAQVDAQAETSTSAKGHEIRLRLTNKSNALAFQLRAAARTASGGLIAPVIWSDNWIELKPGESTTLTAQLPAGDPNTPTIQIDGWNVAPISLIPSTAVASR
ncbi:MAG: glycosyl hydrolase family 2 [Acidobacteria bacterium]|nr:glycosyl hydrolase family 2 [Acidobacteriota bacterium]